LTVITRPSAWGFPSCSSESLRPLSISGTINLQSANQGRTRRGVECYPRLAGAAVWLDIALYPDPH
jgi:hypothetical protein